jgi:hypothetical protein
MTEPAKKSNGHAWRGRSLGPPAEGAASPRRRKVVILVAIILLIAGAILGLLFSIQPIKEPYFVGLWIDQIDDPLIPGNPWAAADRRVIEAMGWPEQNAFSRQERKLLLQELNGLEPRVDRPLVVYLCAHAVANDQGEVFVLPGDARLADPGTWIRLEEVLGILRRCRAKHKLLILDLGRPFPDTRMGILRTDVADNSQLLIDKSVEEDPHLSVLSSCSAGQTPYVLEDVGHTAFGFYVEQGLNGSADGYNAKQRRDGRISVQELAAFVTARVDRWSRTNRPSPQTPRHSGSQDFVLTQARSYDRLEEPPEPPKYPDWLVRGWGLLDDWRANPEYRTSVTSYRRLEASLLGAERRWRGGLDVDKAPTELTDSLAVFEREREQRRMEIDGLPPRSLAEAVRRVRKAREEAAKLTKEAPKDAAKSASNIPADLDDKLRGLEELHAKVKSAEKRDEKEEAKFIADREALLKSCEGITVELAQALFERAAAIPRPSLYQVQLWDELIVVAWQRTPDRTPPRWDQFEMLHRLTQVPKARWQPDAARAALRAAGEKAQLADSAPGLLVWVQESLTSATAAQREAERLLAEGDAKTQGMIGKRFEEAYQSYNRANRQIRILEAAQRRHDEAMARLPGLAIYVEQGSAKLEDWRATAQAAKSLHRLLEAPPTKEDLKLANVLSELDDRTTQVENGLNRLAPRLDRGRLQGMMDQTGRLRLAAWSELDALLCGPETNLVPREQVWRASRRLSAQLFQQTLKEDAEDDGLARLTPAPSGMQRAREETAARAAAVARARLSVELLELDELLNTKDLHDAIDRSAAGDLKALEEVSRRLKAAWQDHLSAPR